VLERSRSTLRSSRAPCARSRESRAPLRVVVRFDDRTNVSRSQTLPFDSTTRWASPRSRVPSCSPWNWATPYGLLALHASSFLERSRNAMQLSFAIDAEAQDTRTRAPTSDASAR